MTETSKANARMIFALTLAHFTGDFYASFVNPLLPVFLEEFSLSLAQVGLIAGISRVLAFIVQPAAGYVADHYRTRAFVLGGPLLVMVFISLVGTAESFLLLVLFIAIGSIGQAMFHPTLAGMISSYSGRNRGLCMSIFNMGGTLAFGLGPLFITALVASFGLRASPVAMILGLPLMIVLFRMIPLPQGEALRSTGFIGSIREAMGAAWKSIVLLGLVAILRAFVSQSFMAFVPVLYAKEGYSLIAIGTIVSLFTVAGAIGGLLAGHLSDRFGYKRVFMLCHSAATPILYLLLLLPGDWIFCTAFMAGGLAMATLPLSVAWAQEMAHKGKSMVSSLMMGFAFGVGGMMSPLTGKLAEIFSIRSVLGCLAIIPLLTIALVYFLPSAPSPEQPARA
ncbi:MAG: MFS transporter [Deltaproteobacteria bacterium]|nr:MFS transporter [Deltaproteobacteria bacterium]